MALCLFAGIPVNDYAALAWYQRLFGYQPTFFPSDKVPYPGVFRIG